MKKILLYLLCAVLFVPPILIMIPILLPITAFIIFLIVLIGSYEVVDAFGAWFVDSSENTWYKRYKIIWLLPPAVAFIYFFGGSNGFVYILYTCLFGMLSAFFGNRKYKKHRIYS